MVHLKRKYVAHARITEKDGRKYSKKKKRKKKKAN
jgi:hypothetical protein